jgi:flagellar motor protein MotB
MNRWSMVATVLLAAASLGTVGCEEKDKQIKSLNEQVALLTAKNNDLGSELQQWQGRNSDQKLQLDAKDSENQLLRSQLAARPSGGGSVVAPPKPRPGEVPEGWTATASGAKITIGSDILFGPGKAEITVQGHAKLKEIAGQIKKSYPSANIRVVGHTDGDPIRATKKLWDDNLELSCNRAMDVTRELAKLGVIASHIETVGMGDTQPEVANNSPASKAKNRRVEIVAIK